MEDLKKHINMKRRVLRDRKTNYNSPISNLGIDNLKLQDRQVQERKMRQSSFNNH